MDRRSILKSAVGAVLGLIGAKAADSPIEVPPLDSPHPLAELRASYYLGISRGSLSINEIHAMEEYFHCEY